MAAARFTKASKYKALAGAGVLGPDLGGWGGWGCCGGLWGVCGQVLASNTASLAFHRRLGFAEEGVLRQQHRSADGAHYHDVLCFGLLRADWPGPEPETAP